VVGDGEPVRLVPHPLQQVQALTAARHDDRGVLAGQPHLLQPLRQAADGDVVDAQLVQCPDGGGDLGWPAVDDDQVRRVGELARPAVGVQRRRAGAPGRGVPPVGIAGRELAGRIAEHVGAFAQWTYDGIAHHSPIDNVDLRYANRLKHDGSDLTYGLTLNNNPTVQDVWNTIPAWSFPYISSRLAPTPAVRPFIDQMYAQQVVGLSGYGFLDDTFYFEFGGYRPLSTHTQLVLGVDTTGQSPISGIAPYWRVAAEPNFGNHSWEIGTFGLASKVVPMGMSAAGTDSFTDIGVDTQYQYLGDPHTVTVRAAWIHENHNTSASQTLGLADNSHDTLRSLNASISYIYDKTWSLSAGRFSIGGTADATLYGTFTGSPNSAGWVTEIAYLPFSYGGPAFWPWLNMRIGLQYTLWNKFDGATTNINGAGRNAHNNNTIFAYAWIMF